MRFIVFSILALTLAACGGKPQITAPAEGQQVTIGQPFYVTLQDNDYTSSTISITGQVPPGYQCFNAGSGFMCTMGYGGQQQGFSNMNCSPSCTAVVIVTRGDNRDFRTISFTQGGFGGAAPTVAE